MIYASQNPRGNKITAKTNELGKPIDSFPTNGFILRHLQKIGKEGPPHIVQCCCGFYLLHNVFGGAASEVSFSLFLPSWDWSFYFSTWFDSRPHGMPASHRRPATNQEQWFVPNQAEVVHSPVHFAWVPLTVSCRTDSRRRPGTIWQRLWIVPFVWKIQIK